MLPVNHVVSSEADVWLLGGELRPVLSLSRVVLQNGMLALVSASRSWQKHAASAAKPIIVVGSVNADIVVEINRMPLTGETIGARTTDTGKMYGGGKGANQAVAAAQLGHPTMFVGSFGNDQNAVALRQMLLDKSVDTSLAVQSNVPNGQAFIFLTESGENSIILVGGSNMSGWDAPADVQQHLEDAMAGAAAVMLQREIPDDINVAVALLAVKHRVPVILDAGGMDDQPPAELLRLCTYMCPNETELARLTGGMPTATAAEAVVAARALQVSVD